MVIKLETEFSWQRLRGAWKTVVSNDITMINLSEPHKQCMFISMQILIVCIVIIICNNIEIKLF